MAVGIENHTNFGCAASLVTDRLESLIGDGIGALAVVFTAGNVSTVTLSFLRKCVADTVIV
jgi:hypothetical protein